MPVFKFETAVSETQVSEMRHNNSLISFAISHRSASAVRSDSVRRPIGLRSVSDRTADGARWEFVVLRLTFDKFGCISTIKISELRIAILIFAILVLSSIYTNVWCKRQINDNLRASRAQSQTQFELCRGAAVNADVSPNLPMLDRSLRGAKVRHAA